MPLSRTAVSLRFLIVSSLLVGSFLGALYGDFQRKSSYGDVREAYRLVGSANGDREQLRKAKKILDEILAVDPQNPVALFLRGWSHQQQGQVGEALDTYGRTIATLQELGSYAHFNAALLYEAQGKTDEAILHFQNSISNNAESPTAWAKVISLLMKSHDMQGADEYLQMAKQIYPNDAELLRLGERLRLKMQRLSGVYPHE